MIASCDIKIFPTSSSWGDKKQIAPQVSSWKVLENKNFSVQKMQIIFLRAMATLFLSAAIASLIFVSVGVIVSPVGAGLGSALLALSILGIAKSFLIDDYHDPKVIEKFRKEADEKTLDFLVKKHGWDRIFRYGVLSLEQFAKLYQERMDSLPLMQMIKFYEEVRLHHQNTGFLPVPYSILPPKHWQSKWQKETSHLDCIEILDRYPIQALYEYQMISSVEFVFLSRLSDRIKQAYIDRDNACHRVYEQFLQQISIPKQALHDASGQIHREYHNNFAHHYLQAIDRVFAEAQKKIEEKKQNKITEAEERYKQLYAQYTNNGEKYVLRLPREQQSALLKSKIELEGVKRKANRLAEEEQMLALQDYSLRRMRYAEELRGADAHRQQKLVQAQKEFEEVTKNCFKERDEHLARVHAQFVEVETLIKSEYNSFRRS